MSACLGSERALHTSDSETPHEDSPTHIRYAVVLIDRQTSRGMSEYKNSYSRVYDEGVDFGQGFDLDYTEAAGRDDSAPVSAI